MAYFTLDVLKAFLIYEGLKRIIHLNNINV